MSVTTRFKKLKVHVKRAAHSLSSLLAIGLLLGLGPTQAMANDTPPREMEQTRLPPDTVGDDMLEKARVPSTLSPGMQNALDYVKTRYKVSREAVSPLFEAVQRIGQEYGIDPLLIVALIGIESGFNPYVKGATGGHGLMQIIPRFHLDKIPDGLGAKGLMDPIVNVKVGTRILDDAIRRTGSPIAGLQSYNGSDKKHLFANRVLAEKARLERGAP